jgi:hypothetical protein
LHANISRTHFGVLLSKGQDQRLATTALKGKIFVDAISGQACNHGVAMRFARVLAIGLIVIIAPLLAACGGLSFNNMNTFSDIGARVEERREDRDERDRDRRDRNRRERPRRITITID